MTKITTFITQGYTPPYVKIFEVKLSNSFLSVSNPFSSGSASGHWSEESSDFFVYDSDGDLL